MDTMRVLVRIGVAFDADSYEDAGLVLDQIDKKIGKVLGDREPPGHHDITEFQTRPCKASRFEEGAEQERPMVEAALNVGQRRR